MSSLNVKNFILPDFSTDEAGEGKLFPRMDHSPEMEDGRETFGTSGQMDGEMALGFEENFSERKEKNKNGAAIFETQFTSEHDINTLLKSAEQQAAEMIENAKNEVDRIQQEAHEKGYEDGKEAGYNESREEGTQKLLPCVDAFEKTLKEMAACRTVIYKNCEAELMELFNALSLRVIHRELGGSNEFLLDVVREAMKEITQQERITIRLNPEDLEYAESFKADLLAEFGDIKSISLEKDNSLTRGGCVIETNFGGIDSRVETKILEIEKEILKEKPDKEAYKTLEV